MCVFDVSNTCVYSYTNTHTGCTSDVTGEQLAPPERGVSGVPLTFACVLYRHSELLFLEVWLLGVNNGYVSVNAAASMTFWFGLMVPGNSPLGFRTSGKPWCCRGVRGGMVAAGLQGRQAAEQGRVVRPCSGLILTPRAVSGLFLSDWLTGGGDGS